MPLPQRELQSKQEQVEVEATPTTSHEPMGCWRLAATHESVLVQLPLMLAIITEPRNWSNSSIQASSVVPTPEILWLPSLRIQYERDHTSSPWDMGQQCTCVRGKATSHRTAISSVCGCKWSDGTAWMWGNSIFTILAGKGMSKDKNNSQNSHSNSIIYCFECLTIDGGKRVVVAVVPWPLMKSRASESLPNTTAGKWRHVPQPWQFLMIATHGTMAGGVSERMEAGGWNDIVCQLRNSCRRDGSWRVVVVDEFEDGVQWWWCYVGAYLDEK